MKVNLKFFVTMMMVFGLFSCSTDDMSDNGPQQGTGALGNAETYTTFRIAMPGGTEGTRAATEDPEKGDGTEAGVGNENQFNSVALYFFSGSEKTSTCLGILDLKSSVFTKTSEEGGKIVYQSVAQKVGITGNGLKVYAVMNGTVPGVVAAGTTLGAFKAKTVTTTNAISGGVTDLNWLLMTSRQPGDLTITNINGESNPAVLSVSVERTAAKITYKATRTENKYPVYKNGSTSDEVGRVSITDYKLVNLRNDAYYFRQVGDGTGAIADLGEGAETGSNYVIDPKFADKTKDAAAATDFQATWFGADKAYAANPSTYTTLPSTVNTDQALAYCMENTMAQDCQLNGFSTGIVFKGVYVPKKVHQWDDLSGKYNEVDYTEGQNVYRLSDVLYKTKDDITNGAYAGSVDESQIEEYKAEGDGVACYYQYWIRHNNNDNPDEMGIMEFAIVRNNAYKLEINSLSGIGEPDDVIDSQTPNETRQMYLNVNVTILPWVVRNNSIDL